MNDFYKQPKILQWIEAILLMSIGFLPAITIIEIGYSQSLFIDSIIYSGSFKMKNKDFSFHRIKEVGEDST